MKYYIGNIEKETLENENFRKVINTSEKSQLVLMSIPPKEEIGMEIHNEHDQFIRIEQGKALIILDGEEFKIEDDFAVVIPAGTEHNVINIGDEDLKLYTIYSPPEHPDGIIHKNKEEADEYEKNHHH